MAEPQEFFERLRVVPLLYIFCGLAVFGIVLDLRLGHSKLRAADRLAYSWDFATSSMHRR